MKKSLIGVIVCIFMLTSILLKSQDDKSIRPQPSEKLIKITLQPGFCDGNDYQKWSKSDKQIYVVGFLNGIHLAPFFGATKIRMKWIEDYTKSMPNTQIEAIISKFLEENPGRWHEPLSLLTYEAIRQAFDKVNPDYDKKLGKPMPKK